MNFGTPQHKDTRRVEHSRGGGPSEYEVDHPNAVVDQLLVQAEKFKAHVEAPKGNVQNFNEMLLPYDYEKLRTKFVKPEGLAPIDRKILFLRNFDQDDEFFHVTSQIEPTLRVKIERGEFVELERLLPKDRMGGRNDDINKQLYQLITQGTNNYFDPPMPKTGKINSIRKWDQAFRVFAAIYTHANPERASKIWQCVYVIHTAATSNPWENVYFYDVNFRQLMAVSLGEVGERPTLRGGIWHSTTATLMVKETIQGTITLLGTKIKVEVGRMTAVGGTTKTGAKSQIMNVDMTIGAHTVRDGTMGSITAERGKKKAKGLKD